MGNTSPSLLRNTYACRMSEVASRELRNDTAGVLRRAQAGEALTITVKGKPVALLTAVQPSRWRWLSGAELAQRLTDLLPALPPLYVPLVAEAAQRLLDLGD